MSYIIEVYYGPPEDRIREASLEECVAKGGGTLDSREVPAEDEPGRICLTFDFEGLTQAQDVAAELRQRGDHV